MNVLGIPGVDTVLAYTLARHGYGWAVASDVASVHLRSGIRDELRHQRWWGQQTRSIARSVQQHAGYPVPTRTWDVIARAAMSPLTGVFMALRTREPGVAVLHPLVKLHYLAGVLCG